MASGSGAPLGGPGNWYDRQMDLEREKLMAGNVQAYASRDSVGLSEDQFAYDTERRRALFGLLGLDEAGNRNPDAGIYAELLRDNGRDQEIEDMILGNYDVQRGLVADLGVAAEHAIERDFDAAQGTALGWLTDRGLGSSSLLGSTVASIEESKQMNKLQLEDELLQNKLGVEQAAIAAQAQAAQEAEARRLAEQKAYLDSLTNLLPQVSPTSAQQTSRKRGMGSGQGRITGQVTSGF